MKSMIPFRDAFDAAMAINSQRLRQHADACRQCANDEPCLPYERLNKDRSDIYDAWTAAYCAANKLTAAIRNAELHSIQVP